MNPEDVKKMSDDELDEEIKKTRKSNQKAIKDKDKSEERKTLAKLNMLEDERLDRERHKNTAGKYGNDEQLSQNSQNQERNSSKTESSKRDSDDNETNDENEDADPNEEDSASSGESSENKSAQEISDDMKQKHENKSKDENKNEKKDNSNKENKSKDSAGKTEGDAKSPGNKAPINSAGDTAQKTAETAEKAKQAEDAARAAQAAKNAETAAKAAKTAKTAKIGAMLAGTPLGWIILAIIIGIILLIILIGFISFFVTMPSLVSGRLGEFCNSIWKNLVGILTINTAQSRVTKEQIVDVADYLDEMGFDLAGYGFLDIKEGGKLTVEKGEKQAVKYKDGDKVVLEKNEDGEITDISSAYILTYLSNDNLTYMIANNEVTILKLFDIMHTISTLGYSRNEVSKNFGQGMIVLDGSDNGGLLEEWKYNVKVDRENKVMVVENSQGGFKYSTYTYDLDGWTGIYGKPLEFLLSLHLATMAPDFAYEVATNENIETKVHIQFHPIVNKVEAFTDPEGKNKVNVGDFGITEEQLKEYGVREDTEYKPYITKVEKHWFRNRDFSHCYMLLGEEETKELLNEVIYTYEREYPSNVVDEFGNQIMDTETIEIPMYIIQTITSDFAQIKEPEWTDNSKYIREMLTQKPYYIYDGTGGSEEKELLVNSETGLLNVDTKSKRFLYALSILENVETKDAKAILKMLKELLNDYGGEFDVDEETPDSETGQITEDIEEAVPGYDEEKEGQDVLSPYTGIITSISSNSIVIEAGIGTNAVKWEISGFKVDSSLQKGPITKGDKIGTTIKGQKLRIVKKNSTGDTVGDVTQGEVKPGNLTENSDITKMKKLTTISELEKALKNYGGPLGTMADELLKIQNETGVNALLIAGITITESSGGKNVQDGTNNWTGNMSNGEIIVYDTVEDCLRATANNLKNNYFGTGIKTFKELGNKYNPSNPSYGSTLSSHINNYFAF